MPKRVKILGERGRWTAEVDGKRLAVIHDTWRVGSTGYHDPMEGAKIDGKRYQEFVEALRGHPEVILQRDGKGSFARDGYIGVFAFTNLSINADGSIDLQLTNRVADPKA